MVFYWVIPTLNFGPIAIDFGEGTALSWYLCPLKKSMYWNAGAVPGGSHPGHSHPVTTLQVLQGFDETKNHASFLSQNSYGFIGG